MAKRTDNMVAAIMGERIKQIREGQNMTREQLATDCGVKEVTIEGIEMGRIKIGYFTLMTLAGALGVDKSDII